MKALHIFTLTLILSFGFGGCCLPPGPNTPQPPALIINPPNENRKVQGHGVLEVRLEHGCLPVTIIQEATFIVDGVSHPFGKLIMPKHGKHTLAFPTLAIPGYVKPPTIPIKICPGEKTIVIATYNPSRKCPAAGKPMASKGHGARAFALASPSGSQGYVVTETYPYYWGAFSYGYLDAMWTPEENLSAQWWLNAASPHSIHAAPAQKGFQTGAGSPTMYFGACSGYNPPGPTITHVYKGYTTTETVYYGH